MRSIVIKELRLRVPGVSRAEGVRIGERVARQIALVRLPYRDADLRQRLAAEIAACIRSNGR